MMSLKDLLTIKISVTHASVVVFVWVMVAVMQQFDLYIPIPFQNTGLIAVIVLLVLLSKRLDQQQQQLLTLQQDKVGITPEFDSLMRTMKDTLDKYEKFFKRTKAIVNEMPDYEKEDLVEGLKDAAREIAEEKQEQAITDKGEPW